MSKITYENKEFLNENSQISNINKVTADDMNEIKNVVNENDDNIGDLSELNTADKSSVVGAINELTNIGKSIRLKKNTAQDFNANTVVEVTWDEEVFNNTHGILIKDGNSIKCASGSHLVMISGWFQIISSGANYLYIMLNSEQNATTQLSNGSPNLTTVLQLNEGDKVSLNTYSSVNAKVSNNQWAGFCVTLLN